jgi:transposase
MLRIKTDKEDCKLIARFCKAMDPELWAPAPKHVQLLQRLVRRLESLIAIKLQEENRLAVTTEGQVKESINAVIKVMEEQILEVKNKINDCIRSNDDLNKKRELLVTIPGVGESTINTVLAFLVGYEQFDSAKQMAAFVGLTPRHHESGKSVKSKTKISKVGDSQVRKAFYFPAIVAKKHNPIIKAFCEKLEQNGKTKMEIICAAMRKLIHIIFGVLKNQKPFDPKMA